MYNLEDKICGFNVNEFHLVTMTMPYIYEAINEGKKITTFFEKDLKDIYEKVLNISKKYWENREKFDKIEWGKTDNENLSKRFENEADIIIVAGKKEYIDRINRLVINFHTKFTLVNCFEIDDFNKELENIVKEYDKILCTKGVREIKELYLV